MLRISLIWEQLAKMIILFILFKGMRIIDTT